MDPKQNGNSSAYARPVSAVSEHDTFTGNYEDASQGLTKREAFAMHAPPIPTAFEVGWPEYPPRPQHPTGLSVEEYKLLNQWDRDPCWDLEDKFKDYQAAVEAWGKEKTAIDKEWPVIRQAKWASAYADALLAELAKEA